jgi:hypothetical protein
LSLAVGIAGSTAWRNQGIGFERVLNDAALGARLKTGANFLLRGSYTLGAPRFSPYRLTERSRKRISSTKGISLYSLDA